MDIIILVSALIGILVGIVAILEKFFKILPNKHERIFEEGFKNWRESNHASIPKIDTFHTFLAYALNNQLNQERNGFALIVANHYGDKSLHTFLERNRDNKFIIPILFDNLSGRGIRVGWRTEYILSKLNKQIVNEYVDTIPKEMLNENDFKESLQRIKDNKVEEFLIRMQNSDNQKIKSYSYEVLNQIRAQNIKK